MWFLSKIHKRSNWLPLLSLHPVFLPLVECHFIGFWFISPICFCKNLKMQYFFSLIQVEWKSIQKTRTRGLFPHSLFCRRRLAPPPPQIRKRGLPQKLFMISASVQTQVSGFTLSLALGQEISEKRKKRKLTAGLVVVTVSWLDCLLILLHPQIALL